MLRIIVLPSLVYPYFELDIEQDEIKQKTDKWLFSFCQGVSIRQGAFIREGLGILYNFNSIEGGVY